MLENDADRLASIKGLGGQLVTLESGAQVWAIFDAAGSISRFDDAQINSTSPQLTLRTSDVDANSLRRASQVTVDGDPFLVREHQKGEAPGWSVLVLDKP